MKPDNDLYLISYDWWEKKRLKYNLGVIFAGILSFIFYAIILEIKNLPPKYEITLFTIIFQGLGVLVMIGIANLFYFLGRISEKIFRPKNADKFRNGVFNLGFLFSIILLFTNPISLIIMYW